MKLTILGVDVECEDKVLYATKEASREYIKAMKKPCICGDYTGLCNGKHETMTQDYRNKLGEIIGEASMCWLETPTGVFDSDGAVKLIDRLESLLAEARSDSYTNGYIDGYDEGKKIVLLQVESKLPKPVKNLTGKVWDEYAEGQNKIINKVSTILNNLKVK